MFSEHSGLVKGTQQHDWQCVNKGRSDFWLANTTKVDERGDELSGFWWGERGGGGTEFL